MWIPLQRTPQGHLNGQLHGTVASESRKIFIGGLPSSTTEKQLRELFEKRGKTGLCLKENQCGIIEVQRRAAKQGGSVWLGLVVFRPMFDVTEIRKAFLATCLSWIRNLGGDT